MYYQLEYYEKNLISFHKQLRLVVYGYSIRGNREEIVFLM